MDDGFIGGDQGVLILRVIQTLMLVILICGIDIVKDKIRIGIQNDLKLNLSRNSFRHLSRLNMSYFDEKNDAEILNNLRMDIENICMVADNSLFFVFAQIFSIIGGMVGLFILNAKLAGLVVLLIPIKYLIARYFAKQNKKIMQQYIMSEEVYSKWFGDVVSGMREIKLFNLYQHKYAEFQDYQENIVENSKKANLLLAYNMTTESITMNDMEISSLKLDDYRNMFSVVSQDVVLFNGTIKDNLCLYKDFSDSAIKFAIQASGLEGFIKVHTLDYIVGERGTALSGGEKQKLSLARAILHDRPILILDEATANTDIHSKKYIHNYLLNEATEKTVIIITHSDEVLQMMDNIVFLEQGKVLCHGTYQELLSQNKDFQNMMAALNH